MLGVLVQRSETAAVQARGKKQEVASRLTLQDSYSSMLPSTNSAHDHVSGALQKTTLKEKNIFHSLHLSIHAQPWTK